MDTPLLCKAELFLLQEVAYRFTAYISSENDDAKELSNITSNLEYVTSFDLKNVDCIHEKFSNPVFGRYILLRINRLSVNIFNIL